MTAPLVRKRSVFSAKAEGTPGTAESLTTAEAVFNVYNLKTRPVITVNSRDGQGSSLDNLPGVPGAYGGEMTFETDLIGGATAPKWASVLFLGCGAKNTAGVLTPESRPPEVSGSGAATLTLGGYEDGRRKVLKGCMGNARLLNVVNELCRWEFTFTGLWVDPPTDTALIAPTYPTTAPLRFASSGFTMASAAIPPIRSWTFDMGNQVVLREDSSNSTGYHTAVITGRDPTVRIDPEAALVATYNAYGKLTGRTEEAMAWSLGSVGNRVAFAAPKCQIREIGDGERNGLRLDEILFQLNRSAAAGDDSWQITVD